MCYSFFFPFLLPHTHTHTQFDVSSTSSTIGAKEITPSDATKKKKDYQLPFDRQLVTSKLASALIMNGMDDLSTDDMNRLAHFFTLLAKTHHMRRQKDRNAGLNFAEVPIRLGLNSSSDASEDAATSASVSGNDLDIDFGELMKEVENHLAKEAGNNNNNSNEVNNAISESSNGMESLTDSDLQTLLQNFKFLSNEEQVHLIGHLRKLEVFEPARVERLRKYVNISELSSDGESCSEFLSRVVAITRPGAVGGGDPAGGTTSSTRLSASAAAVRRKSFDRDNVAQSSKLQRRSNLPPQRASPAFILDDDDDDDYNFDDLLIKANDTNGRKPSTSSSGGGGIIGGSNNPPILPIQSSPNALTFKPAAPKISLKDTENIIANLMGTLTSNSNQQASNAASKAQQQQQSGAGGARNLPNRMQQPPQLPQSLRTAQQQPQGPYGPNGSVGVGGVGGVNSYYNYGSDQVAYPAMPQALPPQQQQQSAPNPYSMGNAYNAYGGPAMGHGYGGPINPWASGPPPPQQAYNQSYLQPQQQQQQPPLPPQQQQQGQSTGHYGNMYGGH